MEKKHIAEKVQLGPILDSMKLPKWFPPPSTQTTLDTSGKHAKFVIDKQRTNYTNDWRDLDEYLGAIKEAITLSELIQFLQELEKHIPTGYIRLTLSFSECGNWDDGYGLKIEPKLLRLETDKEFEARKKKSEKAKAAALVRKKNAAKKAKELAAKKEKEELELLKKLTEKYATNDKKTQRSMGK